MPSFLLCLVSKTIVSSACVDIKGLMTWQSVCIVHTQHPPLWTSQALWPGKTYALYTHTVHHLQKASLDAEFVAV